MDLEDHLLTVMRQTAEDNGRDPATVEVTAGTPAIGGPDPIGAVEEMAALGVDRLVVPPLAFDAGSAPEAYGAFGESIIAKVAASAG